jgi:hypothetical protein
MTWNGTKFWIFHLVGRVKHAHSLTSRPLKKVDPGSRLSSIIFHQSWWRHRFIPNLYSQADELSAYFFWGGFLSLSFSSPCKESAKHAGSRFIGRGNVRESEFEKIIKDLKRKRRLIFQHLPCLSWAPDSISTLQICTYMSIKIALGLILDASPGSTKYRSSLRTGKENVAWQDFARVGL